MEKYICFIGIEQINIGSFKTADVNQLNKLQCDELVLVVREIDGNDIYQLYKDIIAVNNNKIKTIFITVGQMGDSVKKILLLVIAKQMGYVYSVSDIDEISEELLSSVDTLRSCSDIDIRNFVSGDITYQDEIGGCINELIRLAKENRNHEIVDYINLNIDILNGFVKYNDFIIALNSKLATDVNNLEKRMEDINNDILVESELIEYNGSDETSGAVKLLREELSEKEELIAELMKKNTELDIENKSIEEKMNNRGPVISSYQKISTMQHKCNCKAIFYFKEVTYVRFMNTFVIQFLRILRSVKKKAKLVIFDSKNDFSAIYKPLQIVSTDMYLNHKISLIDDADAFVVTEPSTIVVEDMIKRELDVLIIYDRLKLNKDMVDGGNVYKYWVINSSSDYEALSEYSINSLYCISGPNAIKGGIGIPAIKGYKELTKAHKMYRILRMPNSNESIAETDSVEGTQRDKKTASIMLNMFDRAHIEVNPNN